MRLYRTPGGAWTGTQADARLACLEEGTNGATWVEIDVPTDKPGLLQWLNAMERSRVPLAQEAPVPAGVASITIRTQADRDIDVEEAIHAADYPRSIRLAEAALWRVNEHLATIKKGGAA